MSSSAPAPSYSLDDVVSWLDAELALDVSALRVTGLLDGAVGDYFVFATARSRVHMRRVAKGEVVSPMGEAAMRSAADKE